MYSGIRDNGTTRNSVLASLYHLPLVLYTYTGSMPLANEGIWSHFYTDGTKVNSCNKAAWCKYCIDAFATLEYEAQVSQYDDAVTNGGPLLLVDELEEIRKTCK